MRTVKVPNGNSGVTIPGEPELDDEEVVIAGFAELMELLVRDELVEAEEEEDDDEEAAAELLVVPAWESALSTLELVVVVVLVIIVAVVLELVGG